MEQLHQLEAEETHSEIIIGLQREYEQLSKERAALREEDLRLKTAMEVSRVRREVEVQWAPLPLTKIIEELDGLRAGQFALNKKLRAADSLKAVHALLDECEEIAARTETLVKRLQRPAPEAPKEAPQDPKVLARIEENQESILLLDGKLKELSERMHAASHEEQEKKSAFFSVQRQLQDEQRAMHDIEQRLTNNKIERAKYETRAETIREEMRMEIPDVMEDVVARAPAAPVSSIDQAQRDMYNLKHQLDLVGGIDPEVTKEFEETNTRYTFLTTQLADLSAALVNTENAIGEFDDILKTRRTEALETLNELFQDFFAQLFRGGTAKLVPLYETPGTPDESETEADAVEHMEEKEIAAFQSKEPVLVGIDIHAQPPGKRIKDISVLSGGERAMTSVALLCAIMASNPSPFVVLDEVDAALDEANSIRYADILEKLAERTQFIVITHNRATMGKGEVLYGVTMGDDGVSQLLSVKFEQAQRWAK